MLIVYKPEWEISAKNIISEHSYLLTSYLPTTIYKIVQNNQLLYNDLDSYLNVIYND